MQPQTPISRSCPPSPAKIIALVVVGTVAFFPKKNRWEPIVSAMSKKKWHAYCTFATPNRWEPIVVTIDFAYKHTLQHFWEVIFPFSHTLHGFSEVVFSILQ